MNFLLKNIFWYEFFSIFGPNEIEFNFFKLLKARDCGAYTSYFMPCGVYGESMKNL
jgi:hypothetical protein